MRYEGRLYRPPSEAQSYILQASIGCSWNKCTYCDMYSNKEFRVRPLEEILEDIAQAGRAYSSQVHKVFVADGDPLVMPMEVWEPLLLACRKAFPHLRRVSTYAYAPNVLEKNEADLRRLRELGLSLLYLGPESGDEQTMRRIARGAGFEEHVEAAKRARAAGMKLSTIFLLGAGGVARSEEHAEGSARLATAMDPEFLSALTLTVVPDTAIAGLEDRGRFELPDPMTLLGELRSLVAGAEPSDSIFRTNHASNSLPLAGRLPRDKAPMLEALDAAIAGKLPLRPEWRRGL